MIDEKTKREFDKTIDLNLFLLKLCGIVPCGDGFARNILAWLAFSCLTIYSISYVHEFITNTTNLTTALESVAMIISIVGGHARYTILLWFRDICQTMLNVCEIFWSNLKPHEKKIVQSYTRKTTRLTRWYLASCVLTIAFYAFLVLFGSLFDQSKDFEHMRNDSSLVPSEAGNILESTSKRHLPYAFFLDVQKTPWYEIVYAVQLIGMFNVGFTCVGVDTVGALFILIICGYFDTIQSRIENLHSFDTSLSSSLLNILSRKITTAKMSDIKTEASNSVQMRNLRMCVIHHQLLLKFCEDIEHLTSGMFFIQVIASTYNISLVGFKLLEVSIFYFLFFYYLFILR